LNTEKSFWVEPSNLRVWLIRVPATLAHTAHRWFLKHSQYYIFKEQWQEIEIPIVALSFIGKSIAFVDLCCPWRDPLRC